MSALIRVEAVFALCGRAWRQTFVLPEGSSVSGLLARLPNQCPDWPAEAFAPAALAVFGREVTPEAALREGDRLELLRALPTDPKMARRARAETAKPR